MYDISRDPRVHPSRFVHTNVRSPWQRDITIAKPGRWTAYVVFDGVGSNDLNLTFVAK